MLVWFGMSASLRVFTAMSAVWSGLALFPFLSRVLWFLSSCAELSDGSSSLVVKQCGGCVCV